jgi:opacity protein-like surface antigen
MLKTVGAALLIAAAGSGFAAAQNYDGSGVVKFGVFGQGLFTDIDQSLPVRASGSPSGFGVGVSAGYDLTLHRSMLLGIEVDGSFTDAGETVGFTDYGHDFMATVRGRLGFYAHPGWLLYGTAGVGFLGIEAQQPGIGLKSANTLTGFVGGVGTEVDFHNIILFSEYLYGDFGSASFNLPQGALAAPQPHRVEFDSHVVRVGVKFKVGHDYAHDSYIHPDDYRRGDSLK